jgi:hypothetical protein
MFKGKNMKCKLCILMAAILIAAGANADKLCQKNLQFVDCSPKLQTTCNIVQSVLDPGKPTVWSVTEAGGTVYSGVSRCYYGWLNPNADPATVPNDKVYQGESICWCKLTSPYKGRWVMRTQHKVKSGMSSALPECQGTCANDCAHHVYQFPAFTYLVLLGEPI